MRNIVRFGITLGICLCTTSCKNSDSTSQHPEMPPSEVSALTIHPHTIPVVFEYVGVMQGYDTIEVRPRVEGYLQEIAYKEGSLVKSGELLFKLDAESYQAALDNAKGDLAVQTANWRQASQAIERLQPLFDQNAASKKDLEDGGTALQAAEAHVASAQARVRQAELNLSYTTLTSPIDGLAGESTYSVGALIVPGASKHLTTITTIDPIYVYFHMSENEVLKQKKLVQSGMLDLPANHNLEVTLELADKSVYSAKGHVDFTEPTYRQSTGTMMLRAAFPNPESLLLPGQFVRVKLSGATRPQAIAIPQRAVMQGNKGMFVYVVVDGKAAIQDIEPGDWQGDSWVINAGLKEGDVVIVDGINKLQPGSAVVVKEEIPAETNPATHAATPGEAGRESSEKALEKGASQTQNPAPTN